MMERLLLALLGAVCGLALAFISVPSLLHLGGNSLPASANIGLDWKVLAFTSVASVLCGLIFGLAPALHVGLLNLRSALSESDRGAVGVRAARFRLGLVIGEVAVALPLLIAAGLFLRAFNRLSVVEPGFVPHHLLIADLPVAPAAHPQPAERLAMFDQVLERSATLPSVKSVGAVSIAPVTGTGAVLHFNIQGRPPHTPQEYIFAGYRTVSAGYLNTLQTPLLQGRWISDADRENTPPVVVLNAAMAHSFFPNESPLGKHLQIGTTPDDQEA